MQAVDDDDNNIQSGDDRVGSFYETDESDFIVHYNSNPHNDDEQQTEEASNDSSEYEVVQEKRSLRDEDLEDNNYNSDQEMYSEEEREEQELEEHQASHSTFEQQSSIPHINFLSSFKTRKEREEAKARRTLKKRVEQEKAKYLEQSRLLRKLQDRVASHKERMDNAQQVYYEFKMSNDAPFDENTLSRNSYMEKMSKLQDLKERYEQSRLLFERYRRELDDLQEEHTGLRHVCEKNEELLAQIEEIENQEAEARRLIAEYRIEKAERMVRKLDRIENQKREELMKKVTAKKLDFDNTVRAARKARRDALKFLKISKQRYEEQENHEKEVENKRIQALNELKRNTEKTKAIITALNEKRAKRREKEQQKLKQEIETIVSRGGNPYEFMRERQEKERLQKVVQQARREQEEKKAIIYRKLELERIREQAVEAQETEKRLLLKEQSKQMHSQQVKEDKLSGYIRSRTMANMEIIDPLGKMTQLHPSKFMAIKDRRFGLGMAHKNNPVLLEAISLKYPNQSLKKNAMLSLKEYKEPEDIIVEPKKRVKNEDSESEEEYATPEIEGLWQKKKQKGIGLQNEIKERIKIREPSKLERQYQQAAREKARNNITKKQIVWGKEFKGQPFVPTPAIVLIEDFELQQEYTCKFTLTNVSYTFNTFKLLDLDAEIKNFFEITYSLPGRMSAGTTCDISITFIPKVLKDIDTSIRFLAETGPFEVPLKCIIKKVKIEIEPKDLTIDFGNVVLAESIRKCITIKNSGAIDTHFQLKGDAIESHTILDTSTSTSTEDSSRVLNFSILSGFVGKFSSTVIHITFAPRTSGLFKSELSICFEDDFTPDVIINIQGQGKDVSIYLENDIIDLKTCVLDTLYRDSLIIHNRGSNAMKCELKSPKQLKRHLEFVPSLGFAQITQPLLIQVKFKPLHGIYEDCSQYMNESGELNVPIQVLIPDQTMPVFFNLRALITTSRFRINPSTIDFGTCSIDECVSIPLWIANDSLLPQDFGFVNLPSGIEIEPNDGYGSLVKGESQQLQIKFSPSAAVVYRFNLSCKNNRNEIFTIPCSALGIQPPLKISTPSLKLASVAIGDRTSRLVTITNISKQNQYFKFQPPKESYISFTPSSSLLGSGSSIDVEIRFEALRSIPQEPTGHEETPPPKQDDTLNRKSSTPSTIKKKKGSEKRQLKKGSKSGENIPVPATELRDHTYPPIDPKELVYAGWDSSGTNEPWSKHKQWSIPCIIKDYSFGCIYMQVHTTVVLSSLILEINNMEIDSVDFGEVPVNHTASKKIIIRNSSNNNTQLSFLHPSKVFLSSKRNVVDVDCPFKLIVPQRHTLRNGDWTELEIQYCPTQSGDSGKYYVQVLSTATNNASIGLSGSAKEAQFRITKPKSISPPFVDFDCVCVSSSNLGSKERTSSLVINLSNDSEHLSIPFNIEFSSATIGHTLNYDGTHPFVAIPSQGIVKGKETIQVTLLFRPDHASVEYYTTQCNINYGGMLKPETLRLRAMAYAPGVYVLFDGNPRPTRYLQEQQMDKRAIRRQSGSRPTSSLNNTSKRPESSMSSTLDSVLDSSQSVLGFNRIVDADEIFFHMHNPFQVFQTKKSVVINPMNLKERYEYTIDRVRLGEIHRFEFKICNSKIDSGKAEVDCSFTTNSIQQGYKFSEGETAPSLKFSLEPGASRLLGIQFEPKEPAYVAVLKKTRTTAMSIATNEDFWANCELKCTIKDLQQQKY